MRRSTESKNTNLVKESHLDFLQEMYDMGVPMENESVNLLHKYNRIKPPNLASKPKSDNIERGKHLLDPSDLENKADKYIDIVDSESNIYSDHDSRHVIMDHETYDRLSETSLFKYQGGRQITKEDWAPKDKIYHTKDFVLWINSINSGFQSMIRYKPFAMYCQQADDWLNENVTMSSFSNIDEKREYAYSEIDRCKENTLYFMDKYLYLQDGDRNGGQMKYLSKPVHKVLCFLIDCGYSIMAGKPRQIAATSTVGGIAVCKLLFNRNFFIKMIAQDKDKVMEIFDDKIKFPFGELPDWLRPTVSNDRENFLRLSRKAGSKGTKGGVNSKLQVVAPSRAAINGGSPQLVLVDEAGYISILGGMLKEARPTMFSMNEDTGKLEMKRQIIVWGTGGEMDKGGKAFENEFYATLKHWENGNFENGIIPLFFDWTTRPGITKEFYDKEKRAYSVEGPEKEERMVQFRQTYPSIIEDMFLTSQKLLVGIGWINAQKERIKKVSHKWRPQFGYFEPVFDQSVPMPENSDVPFKITGARFIPLDDLRDDMKMASVAILMHPKQKWRNRYYQGTDPVMADNGHSKMASVVFDANYNTPVAILNYRDPDHKATFLQCLLMNLYYDTENKGGIKELVESNIGTAYVDYKEAKGFGNSLVHRLELPDHMQGGSNLYGIDNRGNRNKFIINKMHEVIVAYGEKFYFEVIFNQLRTFSCKVTDKGNETWGVTDTRKFDDDVLFGLVFSYICALSYTHRPPYSLEGEASAYEVKHVLVRDQFGNLTRVPRRVSR